jgi:hypothetical protein
LGPLALKLLNLMSGATSTELPRMPASIGHNQGPPLDELGIGWRGYCWRRAHRRAWKTPGREIALARLARAQELGMSYREYTTMAQASYRLIQ